jgi:4-amino-4-deoxy-L-arabinose transferase-like glycosyltransferase
VLLLALLGVLFFLPGLGQIPLFDRDEPRFATAARTMGQTGDFIVPHFNGALRPDKPPLVYWLMHLGYLATGGWGELGARLPSAIAGILTLIVIYFMVGARFGRLTGIISAMMFGTCGLFIVESRMSTADGTMLFFITLCMACAWQAWDSGAAASPSTDPPMHMPRADYLLDRSGDRTPLLLDHLPPSRKRRMPFWMALLFWVSLAGGTLTKGVPLVFVLVPMIVLSIATGQLPTQLRRWRSHFHLTRARVGTAFAIAAAVMIYIVVTTSAYLWPESRGWATVLGLLLIGMLLTPGLPGILARCFGRANWGWWKELRPLVGIPLLIVLVGWWVVWAGVATHWKLITDMVGTHFLVRVAGPLLKWMHIDIASAGNLGANDPTRGPANPPGTYLALVWVTFWPWSVLLVPAAYHLVRRLGRKSAIVIDHRPYQFLVAFIVPMWILLELARGKLLHYPLPVYVALAIVCADTLVQSWYRLTDVLAARWFESMRWITFLIWAGLGVAVLVGARRELDPDFFWRCVPFAAALLATGFASTMTWGRPSWPFVVVLAWGGALLISSTVIVPNLPMLQVSRVVGGKMASLQKQDPALHLAARGYEEPTLVFYAGGNIEMFGSIDQMLSRVPFARRGEPQPAIGPAQHYLIAADDRTLAELDKRQILFYSYVSLPRVAGINVATFKPVGVTLITNVGPGADAATQAAPATSSTRPE